MDMNQYLEIFIVEAKEHLENLNENLLSLEKDPDNKDLLNEIFRASHTLKGMAGTMGFMKIKDLTHEMENLLHALRNDKFKVNSEIVDILFEALDTLEDYINYVSESGEEGDLDSSKLVKNINELIENNGELAVTVEQAQIQKEAENRDKQPVFIDHNQYVINLLKKAKKRGLNAFDITITLKKNCMLKSARAFIVFKTLEKNAEIVQSNPSVEDIEDEKFDNTFSVTIVTKADEANMKKDIMLVSEIESVQISEVNLEDEISNESKITDESDSNHIAEKTLNVKKDDIIKKQKNKRKESRRLGKTVRVDIDRLDNLMNLVSELIIIKTRMEDASGDLEKKGNMNEAIEYLERITTSLHDAVMKVRMVPIERVFNRFPRMVRDLSKELGKEINLEMSGEETEVDRTVIDEIGDPLIHLIRNSIDHGIESPEERIKAGKNKAGVVKLCAYPDGNNVVIEVEDDGDGIDIEKVRQKGIAKGLVDEEKAYTLSDDEVIDLLFNAGFSTADNITDISGRGVGLDVVKTKIESIGGNVEVETERGKGTKFTIRLPLTLAIIQALLVKLENETFAIPLSSIKEISPIMSKDIRKVQGQEIILFRNKTLPIIRLNELLGLNSNTENQKEELITVIVKKGDKEAGLIIDDLIGQQEIVIKSLGKYLNGIKYLAGATILGNGEISLILDINSLF
ncbi:chemotaxis protein CheA [Caldisalinibacter kiritimatiensis]|uniref:Chemotaxis protein CheA n=1 Tax=Caldisalinibacter kiritimatiensis TaxID=1304284 RepID=R1CSP2_9FIRM|nr:chemotaxis protein CheA [Caldisalinibacter kiritimatiensis]EOC99728.1 Signal transduction histidine kinase CheA [Caldisalinibacter kiritimatiensis]